MSLRPGETPLVAEAFLAEPTQLRETLEGQNALTFTPYTSGLFPASDLTPEMAQATGQGMAWLRDNAHVINALHTTGQDSLAAPAGNAVCEILANNRDILEEVAAGDLSRRLPVRVEGSTLENDTEPRVQNDSVGYALWSAGQLMIEGVLEITEDRLQIFDQTVQYLDKVHYWQDPDNGHWEEERHVHVSSIGVAIAGLRTAQRLFELTNYNPTAGITSLVSRGQKTMRAILSNGVTQVNDLSELEGDQLRPSARTTLHETEHSNPVSFNPDHRKSDAALLFLIEPLHVLDKELARTVVGDIEKRLLRENGIARYEGDTYWSPRFKDIMTIEERTRMAAGRNEERNRIAAGIAYSGTEAQWTLFDPLLSVYWGKQYIRSHGQSAAESRRRQLTYLNRSLAQLTIKHGALRMPEAYYYEYDDGTAGSSRGNRWVANDHTPLLWSQANLLLALKTFEESSMLQA